VNGERTLVAVVSRCAWTVYNFRRSLMRYVADHGGRAVAIGAGGDGFDTRLIEEGFEFQVAPVSLRGIDPVADVRLLLHFIGTFRRLRPDVVHCFTIKPAIYGTLAAAIARVPVRVVTITGLGHAFTTGHGFVRFLVERLYRVALARASVVFFQNEDDRDLFLSRGLVRADRTQLVPGSGVDLERFRPSALPMLSGEPPTFLMIARLIREKGVHEYLDAAADVKRRHPRVRFLLVGGVDPRNPSSLGETEVAALRRSASVEWIGEVDDVRPFIEKADVVVLPSYREGMPRALLEAAAMGRALIGTDVPGCRGIVRDGVTGHLVPARDAAALARAMERLILNPAETCAMATNARGLAVEHFDERTVLDASLAAYGRHSGRAGTAHARGGRA
jgi:glycosyltransferase involved in cell wall biosynthesis